MDLRCIGNSIIMTNYMIGEFAKANPAISFVHSSVPVRVKPILHHYRIPKLRATAKFLRPDSIDLKEAGARQCFIATTARFPPSCDINEALDPRARGVPAPWGEQVVELGWDAFRGSGAYVVDCNGILGQKYSFYHDYQPYSPKISSGPRVYKHTMEVFKEADRRNIEQSNDQF